MISLTLVEYREIKQRNRQNQMNKPLKSDCRSETTRKGKGIQRTGPSRELWYDNIHLKRCVPAPLLMF